MSLEIIRKDKGTKAIIKDKTKCLDVAELIMENGFLIGAPKGKYREELEGIPYEIECSGKPINVEELPIGPAEIINMIARDYCKKNNLPCEAIYWR